MVHKTFQCFMNCYLLCLCFFFLKKSLDVHTKYTKKIYERMYKSADCLQLLVTSSHPPGTSNVHTLQHSLCLCVTVSRCRTVLDVLQVEFWSGSFLQGIHSPLHRQVFTTEAEPDLWPRRQDNSIQHSNVMLHENPDMRAPSGQSSLRPPTLF